MGRLKNVFILLLVLIVTAALCLLSYVGWGSSTRLGVKNINLGLDLAGGVSIVYEAEEGSNPSSDQMNGALAVIQPLRYNTRETAEMQFHSLPEIESEHHARRRGQIRAVHIHHGSVPEIPPQLDAAIQMARSQVRQRDIPGRDDPDSGSVPALDDYEFGPGLIRLRSKSIKTSGQRQHHDGKKGNDLFHRFKVLSVRPTNIRKITYRRLRMFLSIQDHLSRKACFIRSTDCWKVIVSSPFSRLLMGHIAAL